VAHRAEPAYRWAVKRIALLAVLALSGCDPTPSADAGTDVPVVVDAPSTDTPSTDAPSIDAPAFDAAATDAGSDAAATDAGTDAAADATELADAPTACGLGDVEAAAAGILFTSESDYPLIVESFAGEGADAPTAEDVVRLAELPPGIDTELRDVDWFFDHLVEFPETTGERVAMLRALVDARWSSAIVVRVADADRPAQIHVYLAAQDGCGNLVWLESTSVET
jgi:hypothetical protein